MTTPQSHHIATLLAQHEVLTLATCGPAGPQVSQVSCRWHDGALYLFVPHTTDHLFNLENHPALALLTPTWKLDGQGYVSDDIAPPFTWQVTIHVYPFRLHVLSGDGRSYLETIDIENPEPHNEGDRPCQ
jgi:hypothetical protein